MDQRLDEARESLEVAHEISKILNTGLDRETLATCISLLETGVNPEALAAVIKELRREASMSTSKLKQATGAA